MIGYRDGDSPLHRAHPYTPLAIATTLLCLVFAAGSPRGVGLLLGAALIVAMVSRHAWYVVKPALVLALPTCVLLFILHGLLGPGPKVHGISQEGLARALVLGGRIAAILIAFLTTIATVSPARLVEAMTERDVSFSTMYLVVSTLTLVPRMRHRAALILEAQQCRGLQLGGSPVARLRALGPLVLPLILGALSEVDEQVLALDTRGVTKGHTRTPLDPPADTAFEWAVRLFCLTLVIGTWLGKLTPLLHPYGIPHPFDL